MDWAAAASVVGDLFTGGAQIKGQREANRSNELIAREQMAFQERMSHSAESFSERMANTAMQRRTADLRAAGLNPALAYENAAAAPTGVTAGGSSYRAENTMRDLPNVMANAMAIKQMKAQLQLTQTQQAKTEAETALTRVAGRTAEINRDIAQANQPHDIRMRELERIMKELDLPQAKRTSEVFELLGIPTEGLQRIKQAGDKFSDYNPDWWKAIKKPFNKK